MWVSRDWLQKYFNEPLPETDELVHTLTFGVAEIEGTEDVGKDTLIDVNVLADRGCYMLCHRGVAKEVSTLFSLPMKSDPLEAPVPELSPETDEISVSVDDAERCPFYSAALVRGVKVGPSPEWLKRALETLGQRSVNNVVDATNYVMFDLGTPAHAFDAKKMSGTIRVRTAEEGEVITLLGGAEKTLSGTETVISDAETDAALALGGVKGGMFAEVDEQTVDIVLEVATFDSATTRKTAQKHDSRTDASKRFENGVAPELPSYGMEELVRVVLDVAGGELVGYAKTPLPKREQRTLSVCADDVNALLGTSLSHADVLAILRRFGWDVAEEKDSCIVTIPAERLDLVRAEDMIEEVGRVYGYEHVPSAPLPDIDITPEVNVGYWWAEAARGALDDAGFIEVMTYTLRSHGAAELSNAFTSDKSYLRDELAEGIEDALGRAEYYSALVGMSDVCLYEIGTVFSHDDESTHLSIAARATAGKKRDARTEELLQKASAALSLVFGVDESALAWTKRPEAWELDLTALMPSLRDVALPYPPNPLAKPGIAYVSPSAYPFMLRDIALWVPSGTEAGEIEGMIRSEAGELLMRVDSFDTFEKDGRVSYAFHLVFQASDRTLSDDEVGAIMQRITEVFQEKGYEVR